MVGVSLASLLEVVRPVSGGGGGAAVEEEQKRERYAVREAAEPSLSPSPSRPTAMMSRKN